MADNPNLPAADVADPQVVLGGLRTGAGPTAGPEARTALWLFGVAGAVLLIGCANVANLSLSRSLARRQEIGVKRALGISTRRLVAGVYAEGDAPRDRCRRRGARDRTTDEDALAPALRSLRLADISVFGDNRTLVPDRGARRAQRDTDGLAADTAPPPDRRTPAQGARALSRPRAAARAGSSWPFKP